jgi:glyoxylase-like metal-dependent hydrolase (beta-lactamase superfamily II)
MTRNRSMSVGTVLSALLVAAGAQAQQQQQPLVVQQLAPNVYWASGGGGNSGIVIGDNGVIVIDAKTTAASGKQLLDEIAKLTPKPVTHVIVTHSDGDHVNGLASFPAGVTVIAHAGAKREMDAALAAGGRGAPPADHMPSQVIDKDAEHLTLDGVNVEVRHWAPAHTSGDLVVYLPAQKIVFTGDIITNRPDPLIHLQKNGSSAGWVTTAQGIIGLDADKFVPGHGDPETKAQVQAQLTSASEKRARIADLVKQGKSLDEVRTALGEPAPAAGGRGGGGFASFTEVVYQELSSGRR